MKPHEGGSSIHYFQSGSEQCTAECVLQSVQELQPAPGCAMGDSFPDRAETLARWEAMPMIVSSTFSCKYIAKHSTVLNAEHGGW